MRELRAGLWLLLFAGCTGTLSGSPRPGPTDAGSPDFGAGTDLGTVDAGSGADGSVDSGGVDLGAPIDSGSPDDASAGEDAAVGMDAGTHDAGTPTDAGPVDLGPPTDLGSGCPATSRTDRGMWLWDPSPVTNASARASMLTFAQDHGVRTLYMQATSLVTGNATQIAQLASFVTDAHAACFFVEFMYGRAEWVRPIDSDSSTRDRGEIYAAMDATVSFVASHPTAKPDGVHLDMEPHGLSEWDSDQNTTANQWLDVITEIQNRANMAGLPVTADIPHWYHTISVTRSSMTRPLNQWITDLLPRIAIMDYSDSVSNIVSQAQVEMNYALSVGHTVIVGIEVGCADPDPSVRFWEEGPMAVDTALAAAYTDLSPNAAFAGFAVHDYEHYILIRDPPTGPPACPSS